MKLYGLKNCDSCRKALKTLKETGKDVVFHDIRKDGLMVDDITLWIAKGPVDRLINRRSTSWRSLSEAEKARADDPALLPVLLMQYPTLLKRPVIVRDEDILIGWTDEVRRAVL